MKKLVSALMLVIVSGSNVLAQTNFYTNVTNLWYQGYKTNVLEIAEQRLAANTDDIAGLILKAEYNFEFYEVNNLSNAYLRVIQVGDAITTPNFLKRYQEFSKERILAILDDFTEDPITTQGILEGKQKALINEKPLPAARLIEALQKDGYFD